MSSIGNNEILTAFWTTEGMVAYVKNALQIGVLIIYDDPSTASGPPPFGKGGNKVKIFIGEIMIKFDTPQYNNPDKHYTEVKAIFDKEGNIMPISMMYDDREFEIDRICDIRPAASLKSGGAGIRYTCFIEGKQTYLFLEETRWFYEL